MKAANHVVRAAGVLLAGALAALTAQAQKVHTDYDHKAPFDDYRTYSFAKVQTTNPLDAKRVKQEIRMDLNYHHLARFPWRRPT